MDWIQLDSQSQLAMPRKKLSDEQKKQLLELGEKLLKAIDGKPNKNI